MWIICKCESFVNVNNMSMWIICHCESYLRMRIIFQNVNHKQNVNHIPEWELYVNVNHMSECESYNRMRIICQCE
jgi:hypothetical protein